MSANKTGIKSLSTAIGLAEQNQNELFIQATWPAPNNIHTLISTRRGGVSLPPFDSMNLGAHVGDLDEHVDENRRRFAKHLPAKPIWLNQTHGINVVQAEYAQDIIANADASYTRKPAVVCSIMTADCLPILLTDISGSIVAAAHAGWRGLCHGIIEKTLLTMQTKANEIIAWLGPAISADAFEIGGEVRQAFIEKLAISATAFQPVGENKYLADIYLLAKQRLQNAGVTQIYGGNFCTVLERERFFSYRREPITGRMASCIWRENGTNNA